MRKIHFRSSKIKKKKKWNEIKELSSAAWKLKNISFRNCVSSNISDAFSRRYVQNYNRTMLSGEWSPIFDGIHSKNVHIIFILSSVAKHIRVIFNFISFSSLSVLRVIYQSVKTKKKKCIFTTLEQTSADTIANGFYRLYLSWYSATRFCLSLSLSLIHSLSLFLNSLLELHFWYLYFCHSLVMSILNST